MSTISVLNGEWLGLTIDLTGPDGTETIGRVVFMNCPICSAVVAPDIPEREFRMEHAAYHIKQAQDWDQINRLIAILTKDVEDQAEQATPPGYRRMPASASDPYDPPDPPEDQPGG